MCLNLNNRAYIGLTEFEKINWLPITDQFEQCICSMAFKCFNSVSPLYANDVFKPAGQNTTTTTKLTRSIPGILAVCSLRVAMFGTSREHLGNILKGKIFLKVLHGKVIFGLKVYDLIITNVDLLTNSHEVMFPEYSRNIPRVCVSKIFQGYLRNIVKLWKCF